MGANSTHVITHTQYPIQPTIVHTNSLLSRFDSWLLTFDSNGIHHHGLTYTTLSRVRKKENLFLFAPLIDANFKVDKCVLD